MRVVFMGTPAFAATILDDLAEQHDVAAVYTRPDAVRGRGKRLEPSPVKAAAERRGLRVLTPRTLRDEAAQRELASFAPDVICVAAYGAILPKEVLDIPRFGCLNAIVDGKSASELTDELADLGSHALLTALVHVERDAAEWTEQDEEQVTYASKIEKRELDLSPNDDVALAARKVQASSAPHPSRAVVAGRGVTVLEAHAPEDAAGCELAAGIRPGEVRFAGKRLFLGMADGALEVGALKPDGKQTMDARSFAAGVQGIKDGGLTWEEPHA